jgi:hypothetical protein
VSNGAMLTQHPLATTTRALRCTCVALAAEVMHCPQHGTRPGKVGTLIAVGSFSYVTIMPVSCQI